MSRGRERGNGLRTYVALLRGVNLGARNKVSMADLGTLFLALGSEDVATYLQSGNVVFKSRVETPGELVDRIEERLSRDLRLSVPVLLRTGAELASVAAGNPFAGSGIDPATLHVTFLAAAPGADAVRALEAKQFAPDEFRVVGKQVYLRCPHGYGRTRLSNVFVEKQLGAAATTRNWKTVTKLAELAAS